jgi:hypothetical protein
MVIVHSISPKEKLWGVLLRLDPVGVVLRGLDLNSVEDWLRQAGKDAPAQIAPSTQFIPMHRVERIYLDESSSIVDGYGDRYSAICGGDVRDALLGHE